MENNRKNYLINIFFVDERKINLRIESNDEDIDKDVQNLLFGDMSFKTINFPNQKVYINPKNITFIQCIKDGV